MITMKKRISRLPSSDEFRAVINVVTEVCFWSWGGLFGDLFFADKIKIKPN